MTKLPQRRISTSSSERPEPEDYRTEATVDRDRIWYSSEFRRLGGVTQVVPPQADFLFHDRLTHSIKVAQVAESIAKHLLRTTDREDLERSHSLDIDEWVDPAYCYVSGLAHDIGHPPFGHAGEFTIQGLLSDSESSYLTERSFEGNAQSTRIVSTLSFRKMPDREGNLEGGLNPMLRSVAAIAKYPWLKGRHPSVVPKLSKKWSFYPEEEWILEELVSNGYIAVETREIKPPRGGRRGRLRHSNHEVMAVHRWPEAEIMDWADDISYAVHDLEDFYRAGRLPLQSVAIVLSAANDETDWDGVDFTKLTSDTEMSRAMEFCRARMRKTPGTNGDALSEHVQSAFETLRLRYKHYWPKSPFDGSRASHVSLQKFASEVITDLIQAASVDVLKVNGQNRIAIAISPVDRLIAEFFKSLFQFYVIRTSNLTTMQLGQGRTLRRLYAGLHSLSTHWIKNYEGDGQAYDRGLPARLREYLTEAVIVRKPEGEEQIYADASIAVVDYLCSLRDQQAYLMAARLSGDQGVNWAGTWIDG